MTEELLRVMEELLSHKSACPLPLVLNVSIITLGKDSSMLSIVSYDYDLLLLTVEAEVYHVILMKHFSMLFCRVIAHCALDQEVLMPLKCLSSLCDREIYIFNKTSLSN